jgi:hypothetical protein
MTHNLAAASQTAFDKATQLLRSHPDTKDNVRNWLGDKYTIEDVRDTIAIAKERYDARPKSRTRRYLGKFTATLTYYGSVMDMLVQHHPEYVSLAWGTTKFLFVVSHPALATFVR